MTKTATKQTLKPSPGRVLLQVIETTESKGGIVIPERNAKGITGSYRGTVIAIGDPSAEEGDPWFTTGDVVFFEQANPKNMDEKGRPLMLPEVVLDGISYRVAKFSQIIGVCEG